MVWIGLGGLLLVGATCRPAASPPASSQRRFGEPKLAVTLKDPAINESSGLARSNAYPGTYYTHNDSGDTPRFWRFDLSGKVWGPFTVKGAAAIDWEDMASAQLNGKNYLFFGDIGDNAAQRETIQVYRVEEPKAGEKSVAAVRFDLRYPDGPHNAEALMVDPRTGVALIVSKTSIEKPAAYAFSLAKSKDPILGRRLGSLEITGSMDAAKLVTGGDIDATGSRLVLRTYAGAYEFPYASNAPWWMARPQSIRTAPELQGEAIAYSLDGKALVTSSEFSPCPVSLIPIENVKRSRLD